MKPVSAFLRSALCAASLATVGLSAQAATTYKLTDLGTLGGSESAGQGINNAGQVTGHASLSGNAGTHAFMYSGGTMTDLGTLLGGFYSVGYGINDAGQVTGFSDISNGDQHAFVYSAGSMTDLGTLGGTTSYGLGINNAGQATGYSDISGDGAIHAFVSSGSSMADLNSLLDPVSGLGWTIYRGTGINDGGQIVAIGSGGAGEIHAVLLTPVPEPSTYALMLAGLGMVGHFARRRKV